MRATDGSLEMAAIALQRLNHPVERCCSMNSMRRGGLMIRGVWASACLLHVPRDELAGVLGALRRALKPEGVFYASYKVGHGDGRDSLGRYYNYPRGVAGCDLGCRGRVDFQSNRTPARSRALTRRQRPCAPRHASAKPRACTRKATGTVRAYRDKPDVLRPIPTCRLVTKADKPVQVAARACQKAILRRLAEFA